MATNEGGDASASRNPEIRMIEAANVDVTPDFAFHAITVEIVDSAGHGFATVLDWPAALDLAVRLIGAGARLRGYGELSTPA
jgi:hypothetical protein